VEEGQQLGQLLGEVVGRQRVHRAPEGQGRDLIGARGPSDAEIDASPGAELQGAELLGHHQRAWLGSMMPPDPTRRVVVASAMWPMTTAVAELAMPGMLWCSATQKRR